MSATNSTMETVARAAGVSVASVSRVLNGQPARPETERRVREAVERMGYVPNSVARSLKTRRTAQVAFAMADIGNPVYLEMARAIQRVLRDAGYRLVLHSTEEDVAAEVAVIRDLGRRYVDGLIICPIRITAEHLTELERAAGPAVVIGLLPDGVPVDNVRTDSRRGAALAVRHLADSGRSRIAFVNGPLDTVPGRARMAGFTRGLRNCGLPAEPDLVEVGDFHLPAGLAATERLLARTAFDALLGANDLIALGAMHALRRAGRRIPQDVAVVGMDDTESGAMAWPSLTSVSLGSKERGRLAAEILLGRLGGDAGPPARVTVDPRLVVRASSTVDPPVAGGEPAADERGRR